MPDGEGVQGDGRKSRYQTVDGRAWAYFRCLGYSDNPLPADPGVARRGSVNLHGSGHDDDGQLHAEYCRPGPQQVRLGQAAMIGPAMS